MRVTWSDSGVPRFWGMCQFKLPSRTTTWPVSEHRPLSGAAGLDVDGSWFLLHRPAHVTRFRVIVVDSGTVDSLCAARKTFRCALARGAQNSGQGPELTLTPSSRRDKVLKTSTHPYARSRRRVAQAQGWRATA